MQSIQIRIHFLKTDTFFFEFWHLDITLLFHYHPIRLNLVQLAVNLHWYICLNGNALSDIFL